MTLTLLPPDPAAAETRARNLRVATWLRRAIEAHVVPACQREAAWADVEALEGKS